MKKKILAVCSLAALVLTLGSMAIAGSSPGSGIKGSIHDLTPTGLGGSAIGTSSSENRICVFCHAPHLTAKPSDFSGVNANIKYYPLWNHKLSTVTSYVTYTNGSELPSNVAKQLNADLSSGPGGVSMLCLSCHDGSVAVNAYGTFQSNASPGAANINMPDAFKVGAGGDLSNHHPIGFSYANVTSNSGSGPDDEINDPNSTLIGSTMMISDVLWNGNVECVSCHSVHNTKNLGSKLLWVDDTNQSSLCLSCHLK